MGGSKITRAKRGSAKDTADKPLFVGRARPKYILPGNVWDASLNRLRWLFDEFDNHVTVGSSGGKDSTVVIELALIVARERGCLPLKVMWLDQECEFESTVTYQRWMANRPEIDFLWYQVPFRLFNATNHANSWLNVWGEGEEWVREKEPDSIHVNDFRRHDGKVIDRFSPLLNAIDKRLGGAILTGMCAEESPMRRLLMTVHPSYKWVTWGNHKANEDYWMFHPIYDWSYRDVWKAIHDNAWVYNTHYDTQFQYGVSVDRMRVSNYHHETAVHALLALQEIEPETWDRATRRLAGINTYGQLRQELRPSVLPYMFADWEEYLHHLIDNLITVPKHQEMFRATYAKMCRTLDGVVDPVSRARMMISAVLRNDYEGVTTTPYMIDHTLNSRPRPSTSARAEPGGSWGKAAV